MACDVSPAMLRRARRRIPAGHPRVHLVRSDAHALPFPDARFDLCLTQNGLHCFPRPERAVAELARVLKPGGEVRGTVVAAGGGRWSDLLVEIALRIDLFATSVHEGELRGWLGQSGVEDVAVDRSGAVLFFSARRPPAP